MANDVAIGKILKVWNVYWLRGPMRFYKWLNERFILVRDWRKCGAPEG